MQGAGASNYLTIETNIDTNEQKYKYCTQTMHNYTYYIYMHMQTINIVHLYLPIYF